MEINGIANIKMLVECAVQENTECHTTIQPELADKILNQLNYLERYLIEYSDKAREMMDYGYRDYWEKNIPKWHEVTADPGKYPNMKEKFK